MFILRRRFFFAGALPLGLGLGFLLGVPLDLGLPFGGSGLFFGGGAFAGGGGAFA